jgi:hypothetical protein
VPAPSRTLRLELLLRRLHRFRGFREQTRDRRVQAVHLDDAAVLNALHQRFGLLAQTTLSEAERHQVL